MDFYQLEYFVEVARQASMTGAAKTLNLAQPALSQQIRRLEEEFETRLFTRGPRRLTMTEAGRVLLEHAQALRKQVDITRTAMSELTDLKRGRLVIATIPTIAVCWLPERLGKFCAAHPEVEVVLREGSSADVLAAVEGGDADLGFAQHPVKSKRLIHSKLLTDHLALLVGTDHPLASRRSVSLKQLREERWIFYKGRVREQAYAACRAAGFEPSVICQSEELEAIKSLVAARLGIALVPTLAVSESDKRFQRVRLTDRGVERTIVKVHFQQDLLSAATRAFMAVADKG